MTSRLAAMRRILAGLGGGGRRPGGAPPGAADPLPNPALPPERRGDWDQAALVNVDITEVVKSQIRTQTRPWEK